MFKSDVFVSFLREGGDGFAVEAAGNDVIEPGQVSAAVQRQAV